MTDILLLKSSKLDNRFVNVTGIETIAGTKTFTSFPITPSSAPTSDYMVANKKYVDDNAGGTEVEDRGISIDGGGGVITTGIKGYIRFSYACTINEVTMLADQSGSMVIDIWKDTYANYPPTDADSITASAPPTITTATKSNDSTLTGWTTSISAGDILAFNVDSCSTITKCTLILKVTKT